MVLILQVLYTGSESVARIGFSVRGTNHEIWFTSDKEETPTTYVDSTGSSGTTHYDPMLIKKRRSGARYIRWTRLPQQNTQHT